MRRGNRRKMDIYKMTLLGHKSIEAYREIEQRLYAVLCERIRAMPYVEIYLGSNGEFDLLAASVVKTVQKALGKETCGMTLVLPYTNKDIAYYEQYYDSVLIPACMASIHPKGAITKRNQWMVEECDLLVCYVERESGGAYTALQYARKMGKEIINLAQGMCE